MRRTHFLPALLCIAVGINAENRQAGQGQKQVLDPLALKVLEATLDPIKQANTYSFRTRITEERQGTNGQMITSFREGTTTVSQPDRVRIDLTRGNEPLTFIFNSGRSILYSPRRQLFAEVSGPSTISAALDSLEKRNIAFPTSNLLQPDPYQSLVKDLTGAYVIGETVLEGTAVHHLAFTEPGATWQLWVEGGANPKARRLEIVYTDRPGNPRLTMEFDNWTLGPQLNPALFTFAPPPDARQVPLLTIRAGGK